MPISPELFTIPDIAVKFTRSGLSSEIIGDLIRGKTNRDIVADAKKILPEFQKNVSIRFEGQEKLQSSGLVVFNHPPNDIILPAFFSLVLKIKELTQNDISIVMGSEIEMTENLNDKRSIPGSIAFITRFQRLYSKNIIPTPTVEFRKDYLQGRAVALRKILTQLRSGKIVAIAPEGHTEEGGQISPVDTFHVGSGAIAILTSKIGRPTVPVGIWKEGKTINLKTGEPILIFPDNNKLAVIELMRSVAYNLPVEHRGPFA